MGGGGSGGGGGSLRGEGGQGTLQSSCHILHYHMVLRPKGTSHNETREVMLNCTIQGTLPQICTTTNRNMPRNFDAKSKACHMFFFCAGASVLLCMFEITNIRTTDEPVEHNQISPSGFPVWEKQGPMVSVLNQW